jgi:hypothetical protein
MAFSFSTDVLQARGIIPMTSVLPNDGVVEDASASEDEEVDRDEAVDEVVLPPKLMAKRALIDSIQVCPTHRRNWSL